MAARARRLKYVWAPIFEAGSGQRDAAPVSVLGPGPRFGTN